MASAAERALGRPLSKHRTDAGRRRRSARRALAAGAGGAAAGVAAFVAGLPAWAGGVLLVAGLTGLCRGVTRGLVHRRRGTGVLTPRERGLVHRRAGAVTIAPWRGIVAVRRPGRVRAPLRLLGDDVVCRVVLRDGRVLRVSVFTHDARTLAGTVAAHAGSPDPLRALQGADF
ncbi:hypothetical protein [Streptomyces specialis]|uniref:hypothetical protein n=1 Tax=Streptomyces specialis TaxID=498367 RepID=UPI00073E297C|nr:hypothetical protein [Streptomyces specialis]